MIGRFYKLFASPQDRFLIFNLFMISTDGEAVSSELTLFEHLQREREVEILAAQTYPFKVDKCSATFETPLTQTIYACLTCTGIKGYCYACHIECHTDHEVVEVGVRRDFICDCKDNCHLKKTKTSTNHKNTYNSPHNFEGRFCWCDTNPDEADGEEESVMFQCLICEDWFHDRCIKDLPTDTNSFTDFVCRDCVDKGADVSLSFCTKRGSIEHNSTNLFLAEGWRDLICKCSVCINYIERHHLSFILNPPDVYEPERDINAGLSMYDLGIKALASIPPDQTHRGIIGMKRLKMALSTRLKEIEAENRSVTTHDIQSFFADFNRTKTVT